MILKETKANYTLNHLYKIWLMGMLLITPYQLEIMSHIEPWSATLPSIIRLLDEITIIIFLPLAILEFYKEKIHYQLFLLIYFHLVIFIISAMLSGVINENSLYVTGYGTFYYIKYFLVIFIYAAFFRTFSDFKKIFRCLLLIAVIVGFVAFIQEVWVLSYRYIFEENSTSKIVHTINNAILKLSRDNMSSWRLGIYRPSSFMSHYNLLGFYCVLILTLYLYIEKRVNLFFFFSLLSGIYFSLSRVAFACLVILGVLQIMKSRKWLIFFIIIPMCVLVYSFTPWSEIDLNEKRKAEEGMTYRQYAGQKAVEIWKDHPYTGVGPGMFGGIIAIKTNSPYYEEYNFSSRLLSRFKDLDQFWPQLLAETGILGTVFFANFLMFLLLAFFIARKKKESHELKELLTGLGILTIFIIINTLAYSLVVISILYPYCALAGMGLGSAVKSDNS